MPEKVRADSLQPGTSVLPLLARSLLFDKDGCVPLLTSEGYCVGYVSVGNIPYFRGSKYFSYTKVDKVRVLKIKGNDTQYILDLFLAELLKRKEKVFPIANSDLLDIFSARGAKPLARIERPLSELLGARSSRVIVIGYVGRERNCQLWMGRRIATAIRNAAKLQVLLSFDYGRVSIRREDLAEVAYRGIGLQPDLYNKLRSAGITTTMLKTSLGILCTSTHTYELDLTDHSSFTPKSSQTIERYESMPIKAVLDMCHASAVCDHDIPAILAFCLRHGIVTPETDESYEAVNQALNYDIANPFPYKK